MVFQAYSSLGTSNDPSKRQLLENPIIREIAKKYCRSSAQILLKWAVSQKIRKFSELIKIMFTFINMFLFKP